MTDVLVRQNSKQSHGSTMSKQINDEKLSKERRRHDGEAIPTSSRSNRRSNSGDMSRSVTQRSRGGGVVSTLSSSSHRSSVRGEMTSSSRERSRTEGLSTSSRSNGRAKKDRNRSKPSSTKRTQSSEKDGRVRSSKEISKSSRRRRNIDGSNVSRKKSLAEDTSIGSSSRLSNSGSMQHSIGSDTQISSSTLTAEQEAWQGIDQVIEDCQSVVESSSLDGNNAVSEEVKAAILGETFQSHGNSQSLSSLSNNSSIRSTSLGGSWQVNPKAFDVLARESSNRPKPNRGNSSSQSFQTSSSIGLDLKKVDEINSKKEPQPQLPGEKDWDEEANLSLGGLIGRNKKKHDDMPHLSEMSVVSGMSLESAGAELLMGHRGGLIVESDYADGPMKDFLGNLTTAIEQKTVRGPVNETFDGNQSSLFDMFQWSKKEQVEHPQDQSVPRPAFIKKNPKGVLKTPAIMDQSRLAQSRSNLNVVNLGDSMPSLLAYQDKASHPAGIPEEDYDEHSLPSLMTYRTQDTFKTFGSFSTAEDIDQSMPSLTSYPDETTSMMSSGLSSSMLSSIQDVPSENEKPSTAPPVLKNSAMNHVEDDDPSGYSDEEEETEEEETDRFSDDDSIDSDVTEELPSYMRGDSISESESTVTSSSSSSSSLDDRKEDEESSEEEENVNRSGSYAARREHVAKADPRLERKGAVGRKTDHRRARHGNGLDAQQFIVSSKQAKKASDGTDVNEPVWKTEKKAGPWVSFDIGDEGSVLSKTDHSLSLSEALGKNSSHSVPSGPRRRSLAKSKSLNNETAKKLDEVIGPHSAPNIQIGDLTHLSPTSAAEDSLRSDYSRDSQASQRRGKSKAKLDPGRSVTSRLLKAVKKIPKMGKIPSKRNIIDTGLSDSQFFPKLPDDDDEEFTMKGLLG